jgi:hypothetical protein
VDCTCTDNKAGISGGSILSNSASTVQISNSTFEGSTASCCYATGYANGLNLTVSTKASCVDIDIRGDGNECCNTAYYIDRGKK